MAMASTMKSVPGASIKPMEYPFAPSPDVLRTHQKDAYMTSTLSTQASNILRALFGTRFAHRHSSTTSHLSELLYLCLTTLLGNRTLGEEYTDVLQVSTTTLELASFFRRTGYIISYILTPWALSKLLPALRRRLRLKLEHNISRHSKRAQNRSVKTQQYILTHLDSLTSLSPIYALSLATFYFTGSYYHLSKRLFGLRYIFTKTIAPTERRVGYEVLGVLLLLQMAVQSMLHMRETFLQPATAMVGDGIEVPVRSAYDSSGDNILADVEVEAHMPKGLAVTTGTTVLEYPRYSLHESEVMAWIPKGQQRKCTLCLEAFRDPSVTTCGHVFCWTCIQDWVRQKAECPLCRQAVLSQKVLPLR